MVQRGPKGRASHLYPNNRIFAFTAHQGLPPKYSHICWTPWSVFPDGSMKTISSASRTRVYPGSRPVPTLWSQQCFALQRPGEAGLRGVIPIERAVLNLDNSSVSGAGLRAACNSSSVGAYLASAPSPVPCETDADPCRGVDQGLDEAKRAEWTQTRTTQPTPLAPPQKTHTPTTDWLPSLPSWQFQVLFDSLFKVLFIFPSRYFFAIGLPRVFSFRRNLPPAWSCNPKQLDSSTAHRTRRSPGQRRDCHPL